MRVNQKQRKIKSVKGSNGSSQQDGRCCFLLTLERGSGKRNKQRIPLLETSQLLNLSQHVLCAGRAGGQRAVLPLRTGPVPPPGQLQALWGRWGLVAHEVSQRPTGVPGHMQRWRPGCSTPSSRVFLLEL